MQYFSSLKPRLVYVFRINDAAHKGCLKIGETTFEDGDIAQPPNSSALNKAARKRIDQYTKTAGIAYELLHSELTVFVRDRQVGSFNDKEVHDVLLRSGIRRKVFDHANNANEWFETDLATVRNAIAAVKAGRQSLHASQVTTGHSPIVFRPEQREAIDKTLKRFRKGSQMLWNAKMRFGKTLSALQVVKERGDFRRVLILTHRPVVDAGWFEDFGKIFYDTPDFAYGSKSKGDTYDSLERRCKEGKCRYVYFASMQDLRGSELVGGNFGKNDEVFATPWDFIIVDEAHEGTQTELGQAVLKELVKTDTKILKLSGTPFNLLDDYAEDEIYTWDYVMEQRAKLQWDTLHPGDHNPYATLPRLNIYTYDLGRLLHDFADEDIAFNFREFFRTKGDGTFLHEKDVLAFLNLLSRENEDSMYPYANETYRGIFRHTLWMLPGVREARALSTMLKAHPVFGCFDIVNVAGNGDEDEENDDALRMVEKAIGEDPDQTRTITLSCGRLTTGVSVKPWTGVFMLSGSYNTAASAYMQTIFRVQTPATINGRLKEDCYVFDFAPDRTLNVLARTAKASGRTNKTEHEQLREFLNFCPIISVAGSRMRQFNVDNMLQQLKRVYVERVVSSGFEDTSLYNDELMKLSDLDIRKFYNLKGIIGQTKAMAKSNDITVNDQGLTNTEYEEKKKLEKKKKKELTEEEKARLEELNKKKKVRDDAISILRGISIRMPLLIYGADIADEDRELTIDNFTQLVDPQSWEEFMPRGVTMQEFNDFKKYYDPDIFAAAGKRIRQMARAADNLSIEERMERIAYIFSTFRNPDKETVLTPWRVVNMHMSDTLGGYTFFNPDFTDTIPEPRFVERAEVTADVFSPDSRLLEINSKSGLYPLYLAYNIYRSRLRNATSSPETLKEHQAIWDAAIAENIFVICKTPMAKSITRRTLLGFRKGKTNMWALDDLINKIKNQPELFIRKVHDLVGKDVKIKAIVGNPPYQVMDGGAGVSAMPVYNLFVDIAKKIKPIYISMIMPSRWFAGGKGLDSFREKMLNDKHIKAIFDFVNAKDCFPNASIGGGVNYILWDINHKGVCNITTIRGTSRDTMQRVLNEFDVFIRYNAAIHIVKKCVSTETFASLVCTRNPFGVSSNTRGEHMGDLHLISSQGSSFLPKTAIPSEHPLLNKYKILMSKVTAEHAGEPDKNGQFKIVSRTEIIGPNDVCTDSYLIIGASNKKEIVENEYKYISTRFFRFLLMLAVSSINLSSDKFQFIPMQDFTSNSNIDWSKTIPEIDAQLYTKYNLTEDEITFIESMIKPM